MKRKKWSEKEEETLITKYSTMINTGTLNKLKTREKKFKPIAEHVNNNHHNQDPITFPFKWSWRDVSIKVQNMRHQYVGVKQKVKLSDNDFNWDDGVNHWHNFLNYKHVFGDVVLNEFDELGLGLRRVNRKRIGLLGVRVLELRDLLLKREESRREREFFREVKRREVCYDESMKWMIKMEERSELEEMEWKEKMLCLQFHHEKVLMEMCADACRNQMVVVGVVARFLSTHGLSSVLPLNGFGHAGGSGGLDDGTKPGTSSSPPPEFL